MSRTLNNQTNDNAGYLQGTPVSTSHPVANDVLQYDAIANTWEPHSVSALPSVQAIQNIGTGDGIWSNTTAGVASLKTLIGGTGISLTDNPGDITINSTGSLPSGGAIGDILSKDLSNLPVYGKNIEGNNGTYRWKNCALQVINENDTQPSILSVGGLSTSTQPAILGLGLEDTQDSFFFYFDPVTKQLSLNQNNACVSKDFNMLLNSGNFIINNAVKLPNLTAGQVLALDGTNTITTTTIPTGTNIYNSNGTISDPVRTITLGGGKIDFGPQSPTSPGEFFIDQASAEIGMSAYNGQVNIGNANQTSTNVEAIAVNLVGHSGTGNINIDSQLVTFPQQPNGVLKTTLGTMTANAALQDLSNTSIVTPNNRQILAYNGANWYNQTAWYYHDIIAANNATITATLDNIYISAGSTITIPFCGGGDIGRRLTISASQLQQTTIIFPNGVFLIYNSTGYTNFQMNNPSGSVTLVVVGGNQYTFESITDRWGSALLSFDQPFSAAMLDIGQLADVDVASVTNGQVLRYNSGTSMWENSNASGVSNLIFSGTILNGSTLQHIFDYVTIADFTYVSNASVNMMITLTTSDFLDSTSMIWDIQDHIGKSVGNWQLIQPRSLNNWTYYAYLLYIMCDAGNHNKFYIGFQKNNSSNPLSTNTTGYYFNIYNYSNPTSYTYNIYTSPSYTTGTGLLASTECIPRQIINTFNGTDITAMNVSFFYNASYRLNFQISADANFSFTSSSILSFKLNGVTIATFTKFNPNLAIGVLNFNSLNFGNYLSLINSGTLFQNANNTLTASISAGASCTGMYYTVNVIQEL